MTAFTEADRRKILESLTADELATFKEAFTVYDKNNDGTITTKVSVESSGTKTQIAINYDAVNTIITIIRDLIKYGVKAVSSVNNK